MLCMLSSLCSMIKLAGMIPTHIKVEQLLQVSIKVKNCNPSNNHKVSYASFSKITINSVIRLALHCLPLWNIRFFCILTSTSFDSLSNAWKEDLHPLLGPLQWKVHQMWRKLVTVSSRKADLWAMSVSGLHHSHLFFTFSLVFCSAQMLWKRRIILRESFKLQSWIF